ncbi:adenylate/guanylate cyclase domain-containing protein [Aliikangiella sp. G2MR2-5]|uniref:adenylate/guanylate cyclase domain-containing protein n=1 Tax=Aliikangiella sp. G2MR2-5 TaxID=2788943 RepID=UPI0018AB1A93|nr:adenylate/guanylate cyclase domain-containing protein [Aliikangiella sp. G2MR2-5]
MEIKSNRQYRTYVISWFLLVTGLIVSLGGYGIYQLIEEHFFVRFKEEKLVLVKSLAAMIDGDSHQKLLSSNLKESKQAQSIDRRLASAITANGNQYRLFTLIDPGNSGRLYYGIDTSKAERDFIQIYSDSFEFKVALDNSGKAKLYHSEHFGDKVTIERENLNYTFKLIDKGKEVIVQVNDIPVLFIRTSNSLNGFYNKIEIHKKSKGVLKNKIKIGSVTHYFSYRFVSKGDSIHQPGDSFFSENSLQKALTSAIRNQGSKGVHPFTEDTLSSQFAFAQIRNSKGTSIGLIVLQIPRSELTKLRESLLKPIILGMSVLAIFFMLAAIFFARKVTSPLEQLTIAIARLIQNDFNFKLSPKAFGSFGYLANQFNLMLMRVHKSRGEMIRLNKSYSRFVPHQLLKQLSAGGVSDIALGDCCEREMTVLFCDIRGFTTLSETMSPEANFRFINRYLSQIAPVINKNGGIIDKYLGDGIMALFPGGADTAVTAAIQMLEALDEYNKKLRQKKLPIIEVGLGLHTGNTMLGTVGTASRMDATVVSDTVNAAARVESMTKAFATKILITEETKRSLKDLSKYRIRYIASCFIQGKSKPVTLYEVFDNDNFSLQKEKLHNQTTMIRAWKAYKQGDTALAIQMYQKLIETSPNDKSLFALIERCQSGRL